MWYTRTYTYYRKVIAKEKLTEACNVNRLSLMCAYINCACK